MEKMALMNLNGEKDCNLTGINKFGLRFAVFNNAKHQTTNAKPAIHAGR